ncbi:hypothetical protein, partial [Streptomyces canus]|uniref:hypothetical protein n=2 Tax=Streptomyces TaxID=1883 RepID=UPI001ABEF3C9
LAQDGDDRAGRRLVDARRESVPLPASAGGGTQLYEGTAAEHWHEFLHTRSGLAQRRTECHCLPAARRSAG